MSEEKKSKPASLETAVDPIKKALKCQLGEKVTARATYSQPPYHLTQGRQYKVACVVPYPDSRTPNMVKFSITDNTDTQREVPFFEFVEYERKPAPASPAPDTKANQE